ncbi:kanamycin nucleotidyltransferase C-terminal domain-containing protein [Paenibacillus sp. D51F]
MLPYPAATSREDKWKFIHQVKEEVLQRDGGSMLAVGVYGSLARGSDGPYSDIEIRILTPDGVDLPGQEEIILPFKLEIGAMQRSAWLKGAASVDDSWAVKAGSYADVVALHDPGRLFEEARLAVGSAPDSAFREVMREFMVWEPYETMGKIRNAVSTGDGAYMRRAAYDLSWQAAKLIGLANRRYFTTRASSFEEASAMPSRPDGFLELAAMVMDGDLRDVLEVHARCERLWTGLNEWFHAMGIDYRSETFRWKGESGS